MSTTTFSTFPETLPPEVAAAVRRELLRLAYAEDERASREAATVPYWEPCPPTVHGHRAAAVALRAGADRIAA